MDAPRHAVGPVGGRPGRDLPGVVHHQRRGDDARPEGWWTQTVLPFYGLLMVVCGLASGITGLVAVLRQHERSWMVWLTLLPGAFMIFLLLGELLVPH